MGFSFAFISNDSTLTACALMPFRNILVRPDGAPHGFGLGYYQADQPLLRKQPKGHPPPIDFFQLTSNLRSQIIIGHVRDATVGGLRTENTHPFRFRNWIFCHSGTIDHFEAIKESMLRAIPEFIRRNIRGLTDSEHLFHLFLSFLNDTGKMDDPRIDPEVPSQALASTYAYLDRLILDNGGKPSPSCCMVSNGVILASTKHAYDLKVFRQSSFTCYNAEAKPIPSSHLKVVMLMAGSIPAFPGWEDVTDHSIITIDSKLNIKI